METGKVFAWPGEDGVVQYRWVVKEIRPETEEEAIDRVRGLVPDGAILVDEETLPPKLARATATIQDGAVVASPEGVRAMLMRELAKRRGEGRAHADTIWPDGYRALERGELEGLPEGAQIQALKDEDDRLVVLSRAVTAWDGTGDPPDIS